MKMKQYLSILAIAAIVASCSKGDTGPAGPIGTTGATGISGVANINTSIYIVSALSTPWVATTSSPTYNWVAACVDTNITANNVDAVVVYWNNNINEGWMPLPVPSLINQGDQMSYRYNDDSVSFTYYTGGTAVAAPSSYSNYATIYFKVAVIPPALQLKYPGTNWKDAAEVATLPEVQAALNGKK
jgi:hypothetical protein